MTNKIHKEDFKNCIGQVITPGDSVVCVTTGYSHCVNIFTGVYEGILRNDRGDFRGVRVSQIPVKSIDYVYCDDGEHEESRHMYNNETKRYEYVKTGRRFNKVSKVSFRTTCLQLNRLFKIDTPLKDASV